MLRRDNNGAAGSGSGNRFGPRGGTAGLGPPRVGGPMTLLGGPKVRALRRHASPLAARHAWRTMPPGEPFC
jgi:hypothetical protein